MPEILDQLPVATAPTTAPEPIISGDGKGFDMGELDAIAAENEPKPTQVKAPDKQAQFDNQPKPEPKPKPEPDPEPDAKKAAPGPAKPADPALKEKPLTGWQFGRQKEAEAKELQGKIAVYERELAELKSRPAVPANDPEKVALQKRLNEMEQAVQIKDFEKSDKFRKEYYQPWVSAHNSAVAEAMELVVETQDEDGNWNPRSVSEQEAYAVVTAPSKEAAIQLARKIFPGEQDGDKRTALVATRKDAYAALQKVWSAKREYQEKGAEFERAERAKAEQGESQRKTQEEERTAKWKEYNETAFTNPRLKDYFTPANEDAKGKELLTKGLKAADLAFGQGERDVNGNLLGTDGQPLDEDGILILHSSIRNKAGAFNYVAHQWNNARAEIDALKKELEQYRQSEPGKGAAAAEARPGGAATGANMEDRFDSFLQG